MNNNITPGEKQARSGPLETICIKKIRIVLKILYVIYIYDE